MAGGKRGNETPKKKKTVKLRNKKAQKVIQENRVIHGYAKHAWIAYVI